MGSCLSSDGRTPLSPPSPGGRKPKRNMKKRNAVRSSSLFDSKREEQLHKVPGRMFSNGASKDASLFTQQGRKGTNQDAMIVWENFGSRTDTVFCGVFDGHGPFGHMVARKVRDSLPLKLSAHWEVNISCDNGLKENISNAGSMNSEETSSICMDEEPRVSMDLEEKEKHPEIFFTLKESFLKAFKVMDKELRLHPSIDCFCSGTTAVTLVKQGQDLVIGNIGDSRAILATRDQDDSLIAVQLTVDLKPNLPREAERIKQCRGRVFALQDEPEVARVWLPHNDSPGLAMARAFGDFCLKDFGLISVPEISYRRLTEKDEFIVLATDGVWDVLSNKEVVDIVFSAPARSLAARCLVETAVQAWRVKYPTSKIDDCAVICFFLNSDTDDNSNNDLKIQESVVSAAAAIDSLEHDPPSPSFERSATIRSDPVEILPDSTKMDSENLTKGEREGEEEQPVRLLSKHSHNGNAEDWTALDGVVRVNTLLTLPRFTAGDKKRPADRE